MLYSILAQSGSESSGFDWNALSRIEIIVPLAGCLVGAIAIVAVIWAKSIKDQRIIELKRSMVEQGMSAEEIERVIQAGENPN